MTLPLCVFDPKCESGIDALEQYRREWDDERKTFGQNEIHDWTSHPADAFRYLAIAWRTSPKLAVDTKPKIPQGAMLLPGPPEPSRGVRIKV